MEEISKAVLAPVIRHGLTTAGGILVTYGLLDPGLQGQFVTISSGLVLGLVGMAWSIGKNVKAVKDK